MPSDNEQYEFKLQGGIPFPPFVSASQAFPDLTVEVEWSEAALGEDDAGRILFIFSRAPFSMHDLNRELLAAGIGLVAAQHLEGGPEAQLYVHAGSTELEMFGSYETSFVENDKNSIAWPVPNILGVRPRANAPH